MHQIYRRRRVWRLPLASEVSAVATTTTPARFRCPACESEAGFDLSNVTRTRQGLAVLGSDGTPAGFEDDKPERFTWDELTECQCRKCRRTDAAIEFENPRQFITDELKAASNATPKRIRRVGPMSYRIVSTSLESVPGESDEVWHLARSDGRWEVNAADSPDMVCLGGSCSVLPWEKQGEYKGAAICPKCKLSHPEVTPGMTSLDIFGQCDACGWTAEPVEPPEPKPEPKEFDRATFTEFRLLRTPSADLAADSNEEDLQGCRGYIYDGYWIQDHGPGAKPRFSTILGNCEPASNNLADVERELFLYAEWKTPEPEPPAVEPSELAALLLKIDDLEPCPAAAAFARFFDAWVNDMGTAFDYPEAAAEMEAIAAALRAFAAKGGAA